MKLSHIIAAGALALSISSVAFADMDPMMADYGSDDVATSVHCKVKDVTVLTKTAHDCATIGGEVMMPEKK